MRLLSKGKMLEFLQPNFIGLFWKGKMLLTAEFHKTLAIWGYFRVGQTLSYCQINTLLVLVPGNLDPSYEMELDFMLPRRESI